MRDTDPQMDVRINAWDKGCASKGSKPAYIRPQVGKKGSPADTILSSPRAFCITCRYWQENITRAHLMAKWHAKDALGHPIREVTFVQIMGGSAAGAGGERDELDTINAVSSMTAYAYQLFGNIVDCAILMSGILMVSGACSEAEHHAVQCGTGRMLLCPGRDRGEGKGKGRSVLKTRANEDFCGSPLPLFLAVYPP